MYEGLQIDLFDLYGASAFGNEGETISYASEPTSDQDDDTLVCIGYEDY